MTGDQFSRRDLLRTGALAAAGMAVGLTPTFTVAAGNPQGSDTSKILNYNPAHGIPPLRQDRPDGLGRGHGRTLEADQPLHRRRRQLRLDRRNIDRPEFQKNRRDVVSRAIERGIN